MPKYIAFYKILFNKEPWIFIFSYGSAEFLHAGTKYVLGKVIELLRNDKTIYNEEAKLAVHILSKISTFVRD